MDMRDFDYEADYPPVFNLPHGLGIASNWGEFVQKYADPANIMAFEMVEHDPAVGAAYEELGQMANLNSSLVINHRADVWQELNEHFELNYPKLSLNSRKLIMQDLSTRAALWKRDLFGGENFRFYVEVVAPRLEVMGMKPNWHTDLVDDIPADMSLVYLPYGEAGTIIQVGSQARLNMPAPSMLAFPGGWFTHDGAPSGDMARIRMVAFSRDKRVTGFGG